MTAQEEVSTTVAGPVSERIVATVAETVDAYPEELDPLSDVVDPDALDAAVPTGDAVADRSIDHVGFVYCGCEVRVAGDGTVSVSRETRRLPERR